MERYMFGRCSIGVNLGVMAEKETSDTCIYAEHTKAKCSLLTNTLNHEDNLPLIISRATSCESYHLVDPSVLGVLGKRNSS